MRLVARARIPIAAAPCWRNVANALAVGERSLSLSTLIAKGSPGAGSDEQMCGIAGFIGGGGGAGERSASPRHMADAIAHRGPDDDGVWVDAEAGVALGTAGSRSSTCRRRASADALGDRAASSSPSTARSTTSPSCARELERAGAAPHWRGHSRHRGDARGHRRLGRRAARSSASSACSPSRSGTARAHAVPRPRPPRREAALLRLGRRDASCSAPSSRRCARIPPGEAEIDRDALACCCATTTCRRRTAIYQGIRKLPPGTYLVLEAGEPQARIAALLGRRATSRADGAREPFTGTPRGGRRRTRSAAARRRAGADGRRRAARRVPLRRHRFLDRRRADAGA